MGETIYMASDLTDLTEYDIPHMVRIRPCGYYPHGERLRMAILSAHGSTIREHDVPDDSPSTARRAVEALRKERPWVAPSFLDARALAAAVQARRPLSLDELLADPAFRAAALDCARADKKFTRDLLEWATRPLVSRAVATFAPQVQAEREQFAREEIARLEREEAARIAREEQLAREAPTREAVLAAYHHCAFRTCTQGHQVEVRIGFAPSVRCDTVLGDRYSSRCTFRKRESLHTLYVRASYLTDVAALPEGASIPDGVLILGVDRAHTPLADPIHAVRIARQGRGTTLETEYLYLRSDGSRYRGPVADLNERQVLVRRLGLDDDVLNGILQDAAIDAGLIAC